MLLLPDYRVRQRDLLLEISRAMTAQLDLSEVLKLVLKASMLMLGGRVVGLVALPDSATGRYRIRATINIDSALVPRLEAHVSGLFTRNSGVLDVAALEKRLAAMAADIDPGLRQSFPLPLAIAGEPVGLLLVFRDYVGSTTLNDLQILQSFADQAAIAVHNAQLYERMDRERQRLDAFLKYSADGVMILDPELRIQRLNRALERMTGWRAADAQERHHNDVIVWSRVEQGDLTEAIDSGWPQRPVKDSTPETLYVEGDILRPDGLTLSIGITYAPLFTADGRLANIIANVRDITNFRRAQEMQNVFISTVSHELKTPVALIKGYAGTLRREDASWNPEVIRDGLAVIEEEADRLTELIENLLAASKLRAQQMRLDISDVRLDALAARSVERFSTQTTKHRFVLSFPSDFPIVQGDEVRLRQVLDNLVSNAIKYSPDGGEIEVGGWADAYTATVFVRDQGVGISEADQEHIFERFFRVDGALSRKTQGTGLGLYLAKAIVEAHGGSIGVESRLGAGATFHFTLPLQQ
ncbi:MAG: ATP-binding protein [Aggregatilineales bacterium]